MFFFIKNQGPPGHNYYPGMEVGCRAHPTSQRRRCLHRRVGGSGEDLPFPSLAKGSYFTIAASFMQQWFLPLLKSEFSQVKSYLRYVNDHVFFFICSPAIYTSSPMHYLLDLHQSACGRECYCFCCCCYYYLLLSLPFLAGVDGGEWGEIKLMQLHNH